MSDNGKQEVHNWSRREFVRELPRDDDRTAKFAEPGIIDFLNAFRHPMAWGIVIGASIVAIVVRIIEVTQ